MSDSGLAAGVSGLKSGFVRMEVSANNVANLQTPGYKGSVALNTDSFYQTIQESATSSDDSNGSNTASSQIGSGTSIAAIVTDFAQGSLEASNNPAHLGIEGKGWFEVVNSLNGNTFATRDGSFRTDEDGYFVTHDGFRLQGRVGNSDETEPAYTVTYENSSLVFTLDTASTPSSTPDVGDLTKSYDITVANSNLTIARDSDTDAVPDTISDEEVERQAPQVASYSFDAEGVLQIELSTGKEFERGQVLLRKFNDEQGLTAEGNGLFSSFGAAGTDDFDIDGSVPGSGGLGSIEQGRLELPNVDLTEEFAKIILAQKSVQASARIIDGAKQMLDVVINLGR